MLGCENCYAEFQDEIEVALKKIQGRTFHVGKKPSVSEYEKELINEYNNLIKQKEQATINGKFSYVRELNQKIMLISEELKQRGVL